MLIGLSVSEPVKPHFNISGQAALRPHDDHLQSNDTTWAARHAGLKPHCVDVDIYPNANWSSPLFSVEAWEDRNERDCERARSKALQLPTGWSDRDGVVFYDRGYPPPRRYPRFRQLATPFGATEGVVRILPTFAQDSNPAGEEVYTLYSVQLSLPCAINGNLGSFPKKKIMRSSCQEAVLPRSKIFLLLLKTLM